jgi:hypothetical protein
MINEFKEIILKGKLSDGKNEHIFIFPFKTILEEALEFVKLKNFNPFIIYEAPREHGIKIVLKCAYSWKLDYFNQYGAWPEN